MSTLVAMALVLAAPPWAVAVGAGKAPSVEVRGVDAPGAAILMPPRKPTILTFKGPATLRLRLFGLSKKGSRAASAGAVQVRIDSGPPEDVTLDPTPVAGWTIVKRPLWQASAVASLTLSIPAGKHRVVLTPSPAAKLGALLIADLVRADAPAAAVTELAAPPAAVTTAETPPSPSAEAGAPTSAIAPPSANGIAAGSPSAGPTTDVPANTTGESAQRASTNAEAPPDASPEIPLAPGSAPSVVADEPPLPSPASFKIVGESPVARRIAGPRGVEEFVHVEAERGLLLDVSGPSTLVVDLHAHLLATRPETLEPVALGVLIDDVLVQTVTLDPTPSDEYAPAEGESAQWKLSRRATLRIPAGPGTHRVHLSPSESAVLGLSARPSLEAVSASEPLLAVSLDARSTRGGGGAGPSGGGVELTVTATAGAYGDLATRAPGMLGQASADLSLVLGRHRLGVGVSAGLRRVEATLGFVDWRTPSGVTTATLTVTSAPVALEAAWRAALGGSFSLGLSLGGGVLVSTATVLAQGGQQTSRAVIAPLGTGALVFGMRAGPGSVVLRLQGSATAPADVGPLRRYSASGVAVLIGYRIESRGNATARP